MAMRVFTERPATPASVAAVGLRNLSRSFRSETGTYIAVEDICLAAKAGSFVSLVGPSGCGKSTILNMVAGLLPPSSGTVEVFGASLQGLNKRASYMFQQDALLPWKTVQDNIALGLQFRRRRLDETVELARE